MNERATLLLAGISTVVGAVLLAWFIQTCLVLDTPIQIPTVYEGRVMSLSNDYRASKGLPILLMNEDLMNSAQMKANDLCVYGNWSHASGRGDAFSAFIAASGYDYRTAGENLAKGYDGAAGAFNALVASPHHLANVVGAYRDMGVGFSLCNGKNYTVIHYGEEVL